MRNIDIASNVDSSSIRSAGVICEGSIPLVMIRTSVLTNPAAGLRRRLHVFQEATVTTRRKPADQAAIRLDELLNPWLNVNVKYSITRR
jgi:hypothetical protein